MTKNSLIFISHNFCVNCCGVEKKLNCDSKSTTCDKLAKFLVDCSLYKEPIDEEELDKLAKDYSYKEYGSTGTGHFVGINDFKAGYRKAMEDK